MPVSHDLVTLGSQRARLKQRKLLFKLAPHRGRISNSLRRAVPGGADRFRGHPGAWRCRLGPKEIAARLDLTGAVGSTVQVALRLRQMQ